MAVRPVAGNKDFSGWVVAGLFVLFLLSLAVYHIASTAFPQIEMTAESQHVPLPAGPRRYGPGQ